MIKPVAIWGTCLLLVFLACTAAFAHKVVLFAYVEGGTVYTESYFPDGTRVAGGKVLVFDPEEHLLLEGTTDREGLFNFLIPKLEDLAIVIDAGLGHRNRYQLQRSELEEGR